MSEVNPEVRRASALQFALQYGSSLNIDEILHAAQLFDTFLKDGATAEPKPKAEAKTESKPKAESKPEPEVEIPPEVEGPTKADIGALIQKMLSANKRAEAAALLKQFGATSVSSLDPAKYGDFADAASAVLLAA